MHPGPAETGSETLAMQQVVVRLQALLEASRQVHGTIVLDEVVGCTLEIACKELEAEGAFFTPSEALAAVKTTHYGWLPDVWDGFPSVALNDRKGREITRLVLVRTAPLSLEELDFLEGLALQSAVAVENARHHERMLAWERVQQDLAAARLIQRSLLPPSIPQIPGYEAGYRASSCYEVGGDYVDMLELADGRVVMIVADVAGKGLASALMSASFRSAFRAMATSGVPLHLLAERLNDLHHAEGPEARRRYVTAIFMVLDPAANTVEVVNAGHTPGFLVSGSAEPVLLESSGPPLGMLPGMKYETETRPVAHDGRILFYTDGLVEVFNNDDEEFGTDRLIECLRTGPCSEGCGPLFDSIWSRLEEFGQGAAQSDDMTALAVLRRP